MVREPLTSTSLRPRRGNVIENYLSQIRAAMPRRYPFGGALALVLTMTALLAGLVLPSIAPTPAQAGAVGRPFYIFAHNPNRLSDVRTELGNGANALEPDVNTVAATAVSGCGATGALNISHDGFCGGAPGFTGTGLIDYLDGLNTIARGADTSLASGVGERLALVVFDIKPDAATADHGVELLDAIHTHLTRPGTPEAVDLTIILSVGTRDGKAVFDRLRQGPAPATPDPTLRYLGPREGVQVDAEDDPDAIVSFFTDRGFTNIGYGDGTLGPGPHLIKSMDRASYIRTAYGVLKAVTYVYTINLDESMRNFISTGADGIISDDIADLKAVVDARTDVRLATRADNPLRPDTNESSQAYGIKATTRDVFLAGADAFLTFTLNGTNGSATAPRYNSCLYDPAGICSDDPSLGRTERNGTDYVTVTDAQDIGRPTSIHITSSSTNSWKPGTFEVRSIRYLGQSYCTGSFGGDIDSDDVGDVPLTCVDKTPPTISAAPTTSPNGANGWSTSNVTVHFTCADVGAIQSGIPAGACPADQVLSTEGASVSSTAQTVTDAAGNTSAPSNVVTVKIDKTPPVITCTASPNILKPANHKLVDVTVAVQVTDALSGPAGFTLKSVTSNEADDGLGDGDTVGDIQGFTLGGPDTAGQLRAERAAQGTGRAYTLLYEGKDVAGNTASCSAIVTVPRDQGQSIPGGVVVGPPPGLPPLNGGPSLVATLTARSGCGAIDHVQLGNLGSAFNNAEVTITSPVGGPSDQTTGFTYTPPLGTTSVSLTIQRVVQSGGATVAPIHVYDDCGEWQTFIGGGANAFK